MSLDSFLGGSKKKTSKKSTKKSTTADEKKKEDAKLGEDRDEMEVKADSVENANVGAKPSKKTRKINEKDTNENFNCEIVEDKTSETEESIQSDAQG